MVGENRDFSKNSNIPPDAAQLRKLLTSPEAAAEALRRGDAEGAKAVLSPLLQGTDGEKLASRLGEQL